MLFIWHKSCNLSINLTLMKKASVLAILLLLLVGFACKSKAPGVDPHKKVDDAYEKHMDKNQGEYDKDPPK
jgi:hypothetical protein